MDASASVTPFPSLRRFDTDVARKAAVCAKVLAEGRRLADQWILGRLLSDLIGLACDLLDEIDEILVALDPERDAPSFRAAAALHRELEYIQTAASASSRRRDNAPAAMSR
jgi:hypothetical protein